VTDAGVKQKQALPTVTVTVAALATRGTKGIIEVIITANIPNRREEMFIAPMIWHLPGAACNIGKVTRSLLFLALKQL
jgi:hypothetical protein